jgi:hypothetical protein
VGENPKENVRATQGQDRKNELVDWDGKIMPPPVDWETDRGTFDNSFVPKYIREDWEPKVPRGPLAAVETMAKEFQLAVPVGFDTPFIAVPEHPLTLPGKFTSLCFKYQPFSSFECSSSGCLSSFG